MAITCKFRNHFGVCGQPAIRLVQYYHMSAPAPICDECYSWLEPEEIQFLVQDKLLTDPDKTNSNPDNQNQNKE